MIRLSGKCTFNLAYHNTKEIRHGTWDPQIDHMAVYPDINLILTVDTSTGPQNMTFQGTLYPLRKDSDILKVASLVDGCISARDIEDTLAENERLRAENAELQREIMVAIKENYL